MAAIIHLRSSGRSYGRDGRETVFNISP